MKTSLAYKLILISNIAFIALYIVVFYFNRLAADDFYFFHQLKTFGVVEATKIEYNSWCSRWITVFFYHSILKIISINDKMLLVFGILNLTWITITIYYIINVLKNLFANLFHFNRWQQINISILFVNILFYASFSIRESWFWLAALFANQWSFFILLLGIAFILDSQRKNLSILFSTLAFFYIGGASEIIFLASAGVLLTITYVANRKHIILAKNISILNINIALCLIASIISFVIMYNGHGNSIRAGFFQHISIWDALILNIKMTAILILRKIIFIIPISIVGSLLLAMCLKNLTELISMKFNMKHLILSTLIYFSLIFCFQFPITYITQDIGADRTIFPLSILTIIYFFILGAFIINKFARKEVEKNFISLIIIVFILVYNSFNLVRYYSISKNYTNKYDSRMIFLKENATTNGIIELDSLPNSGYIYSAEITTDTNHFSNIHLKNYLEIHGTVKLKN